MSKTRIAKDLPCETHTVEVKATASTPKAGTKANPPASATPKAGDFSPFVAGGVILAALLAAGLLVLVRIRRLD